MMFTMEEKRVASKLYSLLYNGKNIYNADNGRKRGTYGFNVQEDAVHRFCSIVRELKQFMKDIECE